MTPRPEPLLRLDRIRVVFGSFTAVDGVNLTVAERELRFLIGPNGAGKTTLIDVITGRTRPSGGRVLFGGTDITAKREHAIVRAGIGRTFQTATVFEQLSVVDNVDLAACYRMGPLRLLRRRRTVSDTVAAVLDRIGLLDLAHRPAGVLSHGQRQWLEIGMLLAQSPRLLLLDEPVAGMSAGERERTGQLLAEISADHTVVVVEHDMEFLRRHARDVTVLHEGRVLTEGTVAQVQADPHVQEVYLGRDTHLPHPRPAAATSGTTTH